MAKKKSVEEKPGRSDGKADDTAAKTRKRRGGNSVKQDKEQLNAPDALEGNVIRPKG